MPTRPVRRPTPQARRRAVLAQATPDDFDDIVFRPGLAAFAWWAIAGGTGVRVVLELSLGTAASASWRAVLVSAGLLQVLGVLTFFGTMWTRIRASGAASERRS